jgi:hypothetical protein
MEKLTRCDESAARGDRGDPFLRDIVVRILPGVEPAPLDVEVGRHDVEVF